MPVNAAEMRVKVENGVGKNEEATRLIHQVRDLVDEAVTIWTSVSDNPELASAVTTLRNSVQSLEEFVNQVASANAQARTYAVGL